MGDIILELGIGIGEEEIGGAVNLLKDKDTSQKGRITREIHKSHCTVLYYIYMHLCMCMCISSKLQ